MSLRPLNKTFDTSFKNAHDKIPDVDHYDLPIGKIIAIQQSKSNRLIMAMTSVGKITISEVFDSGHYWYFGNVPYVLRFMLDLKSDINKVLSDKDIALLIGNPLNGQVDIQSHIEVLIKTSQHHHT